MELRLLTYIPSLFEGNGVELQNRAWLRLPIGHEMPRLIGFTPQTDVCGTGRKQASNRAAREER